MDPSKDGRPAENIEPGTFSSPSEQSTVLPSTHPVRDQIGGILTERPAKQDAKGQQNAQARTTIEEAKSAIAPLREKLASLRNEGRDKYYESALGYLAMKEDQEAFSKWLVKDREWYSTLCDVQNEIDNTYRKMTGQDYFTISAETREQRDMMSREPMNSPPDVMNRYRLRFMRGENSVCRATVRYPDQLINQIVERGRSSIEKAKATGKDWQLEQLIDVHGPDRCALGSGIAALETGSVDDAVKALAFAQSVKEIPQYAMEEIQSILSRKQNIASDFWGKFRKACERLRAK